ncbi:hypothetical protein C8J56DRAFT_711770, partial [Mycena floridula]
DLEESDSLLDPLIIDNVISSCLDDFKDEDENDRAVKYASQMARACITDETRTGHIRIIKAFIAYMTRKTPGWDPKRVDEQTPKDIITFITQKCGPVDQGFEGKKYSTAVSTRVTLTLWYRHVHPNETVSEWRLEEDTGKWRGLPTRSRKVSEYMVGLEKTKAKAGEVSQSARALTLENMHQLYDTCIARQGMTVAETQAGIICYTAYLFAWLMMLRIDEALSLRFESINKIPGERTYFEVKLGTRKTAQSGVLHSWRLHANDLDPKICPVRMLILLAKLYDSTEKTGLLFLQVSTH